MFRSRCSSANYRQSTSSYVLNGSEVHLAEAADDGSVAFGQGIAVLKEILSSIKPAETVLMPNYPNPFNPETWIPYHLSQDAEVVVRIYDASGKIVRTLDILLLSSKAGVTSVLFIISLAADVRLNLHFEPLALAPACFSSILYSEVRAVMNSVLKSSPPKQTLAGFSGTSICSSFCPSALKM